MPETNITRSFSNSGSRNEVRQRVVLAFMDEDPGTGRGDKASRYNYYVESLEGDRRILLTRPANLKNGFDFLVRVEGMNFTGGAGRRRDNPSHDDLINDLNRKRAESPQQYRRLYRLIQRVHQCEDVPPRAYQRLDFSAGYPVEMVLKVLKWFFIEQDIRYWNYSGRNMLIIALPSP